VRGGVPTSIESGVANLTRGPVICFHERVTLIGRDDLVHGLLKPEQQLLLLAGDSGIGKSAVLARAADEPVPGRVAPAPVRASAHDGSLQTAVLEGLCESLATVIDQTGASARALEVLQRAGARMARLTGREMGRVVLAAAAGYLKGKFGEDFGDSVENIVKGVVADSDRTLLQRLRSATDRDALEAVAALAQEVCAVAGDVVLYLDRAERLTDADFGALLDLNELLPEALTIVAAIADSGSVQARRVRTARSQGIRTVVVEPLGLESIGEWLAAEGLSAEVSSEVLRYTNGYPLFIESAIDYLKRGAVLSDLPVADAFRAITEESWASLSTEARACAALLAGFEDAPDSEERNAVLPMSPQTWLAIRAELVDAKVFMRSVHDDVEPWFHERRRHVIWLEILNGRDRRQTADQIVGALSALVVNGDLHGPTTVLTMARLATLAVEALSREPVIEEVLALSPGALALLASTSELLEPGEDRVGFVDVSLVLAHAFRSFADSGDALLALEELRRTTLAYFHSGRGVAIMTTTFPSRTVAAIVYGRVLATFGRMPVHRAASAAFEIALRPLLEGFSNCSYGNGAPNVASIYAELSQFAGSRAPVALHWRGQFGFRELHMTATFETADARDLAVRRLEGLQSVVLGEQIATQLVTPLPLTPVPSHRFVAAFGELVENRRPAIGGRPLYASDPFDVGLLAVAKVAAFEAVRERLSLVERIAAGMSRHLAIAHSRSPDGSWSYAEIDASAPGVVAVDPGILLRAEGPLASLRLLRAASLPMDAFVRTYRWSNGQRFPADPTEELLVELAERAGKFNHGRLRFSMPGDADLLERALSAALELRLRDAVYLLEAGIVIDRPRPAEPRSYYILLYPGERGDPWSTGYYCEYKAVPSDTPAVELVVRASRPEADGGEPWGASLRRVFGSKVAVDGLVSGGFASGMIGELLGFGSHSRVVEIVGDEP
jgi:hypothetical protein